jgi:hypothetical protein
MIELGWRVVGKGCLVRPMQGHSMRRVSRLVDHLDQA